MDIFSVLIALCVLCGLWNVVTSLQVYNALQKRGIAVSFLWLRLLAPKYAYQYRQITRDETGRVGPLFYNWIISINLALLFAVVAVIIALLTG